jgi:transcriptional regulator with XRE-family HTH domain
VAGARDKAPRSRAAHHAEVDRIHIGQVFRAIRRDRHLRQVDVAARAGISQQTVSDIERGLFGRVSVDTYCRVAEVIGAEVPLMPHWRGPKLARLLDHRHARLQNVVAGLLAGAGWQVLTEETFNDRGDRGSVDLLGWRPSRPGAARGGATLEPDARGGAILIVEIKSSIDSLEETLRRLQLKIRVVPAHVRREHGWLVSTVGAVLVLPDGSTHRDLISDHDALVSARLPDRTWAVRHWIESPVGALRGVWFLRDTDGAGVARKPPPPDRVPRAAPRPKASNQGPSTAEPTPSRALQGAKWPIPR